MKVKYVLGSGYREARDEATRHCVELNDDDCRCGTLVVLDREDVLSGRRLFRVPFPETWMQQYTQSERKRKALRALADYGKEFVEHNGRWYEADEVR